MSKEMAQTLFQSTNIPLGVRVEFFYQWSRWIETTNQTNSNESQLDNMESRESSVLKSIDSITQEDPKSIQDTINLNTILKSNTYGKSMLKAYRDTRTMTENLRKLLCDAILQYCVENKHDLTVNDCASLSKQICKVFPGELVVYNPSTPSFIFRIISLFDLSLSERN